MHPGRLIFLSLLSLSYPAGSALAAGKVVVLAPQLTPAGAAELRDKFHDALTRGLARAGDVMSADEVRARLSGTPELLACGTGLCAGRAATMLGAEKVVTSEVEDVGKNFTFRIKVYDAGGRELATGPEEHCEICTVREAVRAAERAGDRAAATVASARAPEPAVAVAPPRPASSGKVKVEEEEAPGEQPKVAARTSQTTPAAETKPAASESKPAEAKPAETKPAETAATTPADSGGKRPPYKALAISSFVLAAGALGGTIGFGVFAAKDGEYLNADGSKCTLANPATSCPKKYSGNTAGAAAFGVVTALAAGAGALFLYLDWKQPRKNRPVVSAAPIPGGFAASASMEF